MRLRRRLAELEARITTLEAQRPVDYTMPPHVDIDMDPDEPIATLPTYDTWPTPPEEETVRTGVYL